MDRLSKNPEETKQLAREIASDLKGGEVLCLYGELGSGKTVFVRGLIHYFLPKVRVLSPTFIIVRHYLITGFSVKQIYHIDLYRLSRHTDLSNLELVEFMYKPDIVVAIEWAEKLGNLIPKQRIDIHIRNLDEDKRMVNIDYVEY